ncbi:hypothetical protein [Rhodopseudomonas sp.]|uniref:hypothetical protein n=1 Tax=Rhodopseudomonas sp. TaxID=1078 RepID=UPI0039E46955
MQLGSVDDFLAFDTARRYAVTGEVPPKVAVAFELEALPQGEPHDSEWLRCMNFLVRRSSAGASSKEDLHAR